MRAAGEGRKSNLETTRLVGIGLMLSGILAFTFAVLGVSGAGATGAAKPAHDIPTCSNTAAGSPLAQVIQDGYNTGCNDGTTSTTKPCNTTTTTKTPCTCSTTTTTTEVGATSSTTASTTTSSTTTSSTTASTTTSSTTTSTTGVGASTSTTDTSPVSAGFVTTTTGGKTIVVEGTTAVLAPPQIGVSPSSGVLPFTGSNTAPLVGLGIVLVGAGFGLSRKKRNLGD